jgi:hypothetical protein
MVVLSRKTIKCQGCLFTADGAYMAHLSIIESCSSVTLAVVYFLMLRRLKIASNVFMMNVDNY